MMPKYIGLVLIISSYSNVPILSFLEIRVSSSYFVRKFSGCEVRVKAMRIYTNPICNLDKCIWKIKSNTYYKFYIFCKQDSRSGSESESDESEDDFDGTRFKVESQLNVKRFLKVKY